MQREQVWKGLGWLAVAGSTAMLVVARHYLEQPNPVGALGCLLASWMAAMGVVLAAAAGVLASRESGRSRLPALAALASVGAGVVASVVFGALDRPEAALLGQMIGVGAGTAFAALQLLLGAG